MNLYDTRFFFEHYYSDSSATLAKTRGHLRAKGAKYVSAVTIHEVYKLSMEREGREVADLRATLIEKEFEVVPMESRVAKMSAELRSKYRIPMADSIVAASAWLFRLRCVSDDPHLSKIKEIEVQWI